MKVVDHSLIVWLFVRKNFHWRLVGIFFFSCFMCKSWVHSNFCFLVKIHICTSLHIYQSFLSPIIKSNRIRQKINSQIVEFSVAIMESLENVVILMRVKQDALLAPLEFPSQVTNTTFLASIKLLRKKEHWEYIMLVEKWNIRTFISVFWDYNSLGSPFKCLQLNAKVKEERPILHWYFFRSPKIIFAPPTQHWNRKVFRDECECHLKQGRQPQFCQLYGIF